MDDLTRERINLFGSRDPSGRLTNFKAMLVVLDCQMRDDRAVVVVEDQLSDAAATLALMRNGEVYATRSDVLVGYWDSSVVWADEDPMAVRVQREQAILEIVEALPKTTNETIARVYAALITTRTVVVTDDSGNTGTWKP